MLPSGLGAATDNPSERPVDEPNIAWLQPILDPAAVVTSRESLRLALVASLQHLPAQQRAVLLLRDVLGFPAVEVADMLDISVAAVKSALQRARATIKDAAPSPEEITEPTEPRARELLECYIAAFENADAALLEKALRHDAALEIVGSRTWFAGRATCVPYIATQVLGSPGDWRMRPIIANGQPAAAAYHRGEPFGIAVLTITATGITRLVIFGDPSLLTRPRPGW
jgi:RNA polymerase sigma-70 factor (ECF subfamily)